MLVDREFTRYKQNGVWGNIAAFSIAALFLLLWHPLVSIIWPAYMSIGPKYGLGEFIHAGIWSCTQNVIVHYTFCAIFYVIYKGKFPFFEQYRAKAHENEQWPWESESPKVWR